MTFKSNGAVPRRNAYMHLKGERVHAHNLIVGAGTIATGVLGVTFHSLASKEPTALLAVNK
jgi:hypothetical protein